MKKHLSLAHQNIISAHSRIQNKNGFQKVGNIVSACFKVKLSDLQSPLRCNARIAFSRQVAMYLTHIVCGMSLTQVGQLFCRDRTTVSYACRLIEDHRDDPQFDAMLTTLEYALVSENGFQLIEPVS